MKQDQRVCVDLFEHRILTTIQLYGLHLPSYARERKRLLELHRLELPWRTPPQQRQALLPPKREDAARRRSRERSVERSRERSLERSSPLDPDSRESAGGKA
jgi:hypothetical protein